MLFISTAFSHWVLTHYQTTNFRLFQTEKIADDNFKLDKNDGKFSKWIENTVGKGEIARYEQFLLFPQCFQKASFPGVSKGVIVWEWVKNPFSVSSKCENFVLFLVLNVMSAVLRQLVVLHCTWARHCRDLA